MRTNTARVLCLCLLMMMGMWGGAMGQNGTLVGSPSFATTHTGFGQELVVNGTTQLVNIPGPNGFDVPAGGDYTFECWIKTTSSTGVQVILGRNPGIYMACTGGKLSFAPFNNSVSYNSTASINDGNWHHVAMTMVGGSTARLFFDGSLVLSESGTLSPPSWGVGCIGAYSMGGNNFAGSIDEVRLSSTARYTSAFTAPTVPFTSDANTVGLYHLDGDAISSGSAPAAFVAAANNAAWVVSPYNWNRTGAGGDITVDAGAYRRILFTSSAHVLLNFTTTQNGSYPPYIEVRFDGGTWTRYAVTTNTLVTPPGATVRERLMEIVLVAPNIGADQWNGNPPASALWFTSAWFDLGAAVTAPARRSLNVLVYGNSITIGHNALNYSATYNNDDDASLGYGLLLGDRLNAEVGVVGFSGLGITTNLAGNNVPPLTSSWNYQYAGVSRVLSPAPDMCCIDLSQNDGGSTSAALIAGMVAVAQGVTAAAPNCKFVFPDAVEGGVLGSIQTAAQQVGATFVGSTRGVLNYTTDSYDANHPTAAATLARLLPLIAAGATTALTANGTKRRLQ
jgi:hypothetical protein